MSRAPDLHALSDEFLARLSSGVSEHPDSLAELRRAGYGLVAVPVELGGLGGNLLQVSREQRRLARQVPAAAAAFFMHLAWTGVAADLWRRGDKTLLSVLEEAVVDGALVTGNGNDSADRVAYTCFGVDDPLTLHLLAWSQCLSASVDLGMADRSLRSATTIESEVKHSTLHLTDLALELEVASMVLEQIADDWSTGVDHGSSWEFKITAARHCAATVAERARNLAMNGGSPM